MKKIIYIVLLFTLSACNNEDGNDCFQKAGTVIQQEFIVGSFDKILVNRNVELILKEGPDYKVVIQSGKNLINDVEAVVIGNELRLTDNNTCNYVREYGITKAYVTSPNIIEIRSSTQYDISSDGILNYENLNLFSEDFNAEGTFTVGDFRLEINAIELDVSANNLSAFYISGETEKLVVSFFAGIGRFEGANLIAQNVRISHRGSNDMIINPQQSLRGIIRGTGDVITLNSPPIIEVEQIYSGRLIFY